MFRKYVIMISSNNFSGGTILKKIIFILIILNNFVFGNINNKFISAFEKCDITGIKTALKNGANINTVAYTMDYVNSSALTFALRNNRREIAKFLIENGIDVNIVGIRQRFVNFSANRFISLFETIAKKYILSESL